MNIHFNPLVIVSFKTKFAVQTGLPPRQGLVNGNVQSYIVCTCMATALWAACVNVLLYWSVVILIGVVFATLLAPQWEGVWSQDPYPYHSRLKERAWQHISCPRGEPHSRLPLPLEIDTLFRWEERTYE